MTNHTTVALRPAVSKAKTMFIFGATILLGFILFFLPNLFFGITSANGGLRGINLLIIALFQFTTVTALLYFSLKLLHKDFQYIGLSWTNWPRDTALGIVSGLGWTTLQFAWLIPATGGANRLDIAQMLESMDGSVIGMLSYIALGVIGGGITEELFNRGYFITVLKDLFKNPKKGLWIASLVSILFFAVGHMPTNAIDWIDILIPTIAYTLLFLFTRRLTASIWAHAVYNFTAILLTYYIYYL